MNIIFVEDSFIEIDEEVTFKLRDVVQNPSKGKHDGFEMSVITGEHREFVRLTTGDIFFSGNKKEIDRIKKELRAKPESIIIAALESCTRENIYLYRQSKRENMMTKRRENTEDIGALLDVCERFISGSRDSIIDVEKSAERLMFATRNPEYWADPEGLEYAKSIVKSCTELANKI